MTRRFSVGVRPLGGYGVVVSLLLGLAPTKAWAQSGYAVRTDGTSYVEVPDAGHPTLRITGSITIASWFRYEGAGAASGRIVGKSSAPSENPAKYCGLFLAGTVGGQQSPGFFLNGNDAAQSWLTLKSASNAPFFPKWIHLVGVFNAAAVPSAGTLYVNGVVAQSADVPFQGINMGSGALRLGQDDHANLGTVGTSDEVAIWNRALTPDEAKSLPNRTPQPNEAGLVLLWDFETVEERGAVTYVIDTSGHGNDGAIVGAKRVAVQEEAVGSAGGGTSAPGQGGASSLGNTGAGTSSSTLDPTSTAPSPDAAKAGGTCTYAPRRSWGPMGWLVLGIAMTLVRWRRVGRRSKS